MNKTAGSATIKFRAAHPSVYIMEKDKHLFQLRDSLLHLHKVLLEHQKREYEGAHKKVASTGHYFKLVTSHRDFAWLKTLSELIVSMDIVLEGKDETGENVDDLIEYVKKLLSTAEPRNELAEKYRQAIKSDPAAAVAHGKVAEILRENIK